MYCALERLDSAQFLSHAARTHTLPFPRTRSNNTHKHTSTLWTPSFSFFPPLVYLRLFACIGSSADLSRLPSVHLLIRSTGCSGNVQTLLSAQLAERSPYTTACQPDPEIQTHCLTKGINHLCLHNWPGCPLSTRPGAGHPLMQTQRQCVVGVKMMEWNSTFQKSQSSSACYSSRSWWIIISQTIF